MKSGYAVDFRITSYRQAKPGKSKVERKELGAFYCGSMTQPQTAELMSMVQYYCKEGKKHCGTVPVVVGVRTVQQYHGWIVVEKNGDGVKDSVYVEWTDAAGERQKEFKGYGESGCTKAVEWWNAKLKKPIKLEATLRGCYRVVTT